MIFVILYDICFTNAEQYHSCICYDYTLCKTFGYNNLQILIYCRSSTIPEHHWPVNDHKHFTLDVVYLHDKPSSGNCPQKVYDALVEALEHVSEHEGYIFENQGVARALFKQMCILLSHPQQRCIQEDIDIPKSLVKKVLAIDAPTDEGVSVPNQ